MPPAGATPPHQVLQPGPPCAEIQGMECIRCGAGAVVNRDDGDFCGECALRRDWQKIIALVQDARVETPVAGRGATG